MNERIPDHDLDLVHRLGLEIADASRARNLHDRFRSLSFAATLAEEIDRAVARRFGYEAARPWTILAGHLRRESAEISDRVPPEVVG